MTYTPQYLLSVVIPIYNVALYLDQCVQSVLSQSFRDDELQIILIDDGSTDGSREISEKYARRYPNVESYSQVNAGLSAARNAGLDRVRGEFLVFLDSDDIVPPGVYRRMLDVLQRSQSDFVTGPAWRFSAHQRTAWPFTRNSDLFLEDLSAITLDSHPEFLRDFTAWNKIYRSEFFLQSGVRFPEGRIYEDVATSPRLYLQATAFDVVSEPAYYWRVTPGSITQTLKPVKALDRLWALQTVKDHLVEHRTADHIREAYDFAVIDYNLRWVLGEYSLFDPDTRDQIRQRSVALLAGVSQSVLDRLEEPLKTWATLARDQQVAQLHDVLMSVDAGSEWEWLNRRVDNLKIHSQRRVKHLFLYLVFRPLVFLLPIAQKTAVISNYWGNKFSSADGPAAVSRALFEHRSDFNIIVFASQRRYAEIRTTVRAMFGESRRVKVIRNQSLRYYFHVWNAKYLFNDVNFPLGFMTDKLVGKRSGQVEVQTSHGIPLKKMGLDSSDAIPRQELRKFLAKSARYDYLAAPSKLIGETFARAHGVSPQFIQSGLPQNDTLFSPVSDRDSTAIRTKYGLDPSRKIILYAPTFRYGNGYAFRYLMDFETLHEKFGDEFQMVINMHPWNHTHLQMIDFKEITNFSNASAVGGQPFVKLFGNVHDNPEYVPATTSPEQGSTVAAREFVAADINELLTVADVFITDYSSLMFNAAHREIPQISYVPDIDYYEQTRGMYFSLKETAPGAVTTTQAELTDALEIARNPNVWEQQYGASRAAFKEKFLTWERGNASVKILQALGIVDAYDEKAGS